ncbi:hypothetical protein [Acinetobacter kanungonis]|uniref:hypothetical protein n=1 Tax=Acinetobacter kanungonis TaxID=2699469 RepID=UPI001F2402CC|nr:hypothetical protein [Acinetobacter kanungonis]
MNKKSLIFGVLVTFIWLLGIYLFSRSNGYTWPTSLNELGDFLAGIFAPIAFFWLILGYIQQGKQLDQNTRALEQQESALKLQIDEMRESINQQKNVVTHLNQRSKEEKSKVRPLLGFNRFLCQRIGEDKYRLHCEIHNRGTGDAINMKILWGEISTNPIKIAVNNVEKMVWDQEIVGIFEGSEVLKDKLDLEYENVLGDLIVITKKIMIKNVKGSQTYIVEID